MTVHPLPLFCYLYARPTPLRPSYAIRSGGWTISDLFVFANNPVRLCDTPTPIGLNDKSQWAEVGPPGVSLPVVLLANKVGNA